MTSRQSWKISSCVPGLKTASKLNWLVKTSSSLGASDWEALLAKLDAAPRSTSNVMLSNAWTPGSSPALASRWLKGRMRQNTRMEPFKSSIVLCILRRSLSGSTSSCSGMPSALAACVTMVSFSLASRSASMLVLSVDMAMSTALATEARTSLPTKRSQSTRSLSDSPPRRASRSAACKRALAAEMESLHVMSTAAACSTTSINADHACLLARSASSVFFLASAFCASSRWSSRRLRMDSSSSRFLAAPGSLPLGSSDRPAIVRPFAWLTPSNSNAWRITVANARASERATYNSS
mmetsp:Transcript_87551/g.252484  ORF Transcript_87551/g.252484 Transcript_87551/m.252484 type:complete len:295 (-) Transcript_87551:195-1079(-)